MKQTFNSIFFVLVFVLFTTTGSAQTLSQLIKAGDKEFEAEDYYAATSYYRDALKKDEENAGLWYKLAESSRMFNDYAGAADQYRNVTKYDKVNEYPMAWFWLGEMLRSSCDCKTDDAIKALKKFRTKYKGKDYFAAKAQQELEACAWVLDHKQGRDSIQIEHLGNDVNTTASEFNAINVYPDKLQFSSLRNTSTDKKSPKYLVRIYNQQPNPEAVYMPAGSNPSLSIGNGAYSPDAKKFFFTECQQKGKTSSRCDIYVTKYENYRWTDAQKLNINDGSSSNSHPAPGIDKSGKEVLFFASNRAGGKGGYDIWVSTLNADGTYAPPVNAGDAINTQGNEVTPFYDVNNKKLFFSSDWHYGYGAFDIFESKGEYDKWETPKNLMKPINTAQNDLYYTIASDNSKAYITSNRKGSLFIEAETCCNDIYAYVNGKKIERKIDTTTVAVKKDTLVAKRDTVATAIVETKVARVDTPVATANVTVEKTEPQVEPRKFVDLAVRKVKQLLPVTLYFHNDEPECCNLRDTTALDYKQTYEGYTVLLNEYEKQFSRGLVKNEKTEAEQKVFQLFQSKVDKGFYDLVAFSAQLLEILQAGEKIEVTIKGYCSPLNYNAYNIKLGYRRVASLRNYFFHYRNGILLPYINSGALVLKSESLGEETSPKDVSDKLEDTRNSVYNPAAALERRVEIISVEVK